MKPLDDQQRNLVQMQAAALARLKALEAERRNMRFEDFIKAVAPNYQFFRHTQVLVDALQKVADGEIKRLLVQMPPRHGKSYTTSQLFPAYHAFRFPERWVGITTYGSELSFQFSRMARGFFQEAGGQINPESAAVANWQTRYGGGVWATGVGGPLTGRGCHLGLIDDPLRNNEDADSQTIRDKQRDWYGATFYTRLEPGGALVVVQTRWHLDDLTGWLLEQERAGATQEKWHIICFEAIRTDEDFKVPPGCTLEADWREEGEALCPERYPIDTLENIKRQLGLRFYQALYQQSPTPAEGALFRRSAWGYYDELPERFDRLVSAWDLTFKATASSDYVASVVLGQVDETFYVLDIVNTRLDFPNTVIAIQNQRRNYPKLSAICIEDAANGPAVLATLKRAIGNLVPVKPAGGKLARASSISGYVDAGSVLLPRGGAWVQEWVEHFAAFPVGAHDDLVDALSHAMNYCLHGGSRISGSRGKYQVY